MFSLTACTKAPPEVPDTKVTFLTCPDGSTRPWSGQGEQADHLNTDGRGPVPWSKDQPSSLTVSMACAVPTARAREDHRKAQEALKSKNKNKPSGLSATLGNQLGLDSK
jgi:hypothetical protein